MFRILILVSLMRCGFISFAQDIGFISFNLVFDTLPETKEARQLVELRSAFYAARLQNMDNRLNEHTNPCRDCFHISDEPYYSDCLKFYNKMMHDLRKRRDDSARVFQYRLAQFEDSMYLRIRNFIVASARVLAYDKHLSYLLDADKMPCFLPETDYTSELIKRLLNRK